MSRDVALDGIRGVGVLLMLVDHCLLAAQTHGQGWALWVRAGVTRPSLPLLMLVSGALLWRRAWRPGVLGACRWRSGVFVHQAGRVAPWAVVMWAVRSRAPWVGVDVLTLYCAALVPVGLVFASRALLPGVVSMLLVASVVWPADGSYSVAWVAGWVVLGACADEWHPSWARWGGRLPPWIGAVGRQSLPLYVGQLLAMSVFWS